MTTWRFHTPDGVVDILPEDCERKRDIEAGIRSVLRGRGYREIQTPVMEFYDVYAAGDEFVPQEELFKFFDDQGRILCLRYDGTIPVARCAATHFKSKAVPQRLCYLGEMFRYNESGGGRQREFSQAGAEILGVNTPEADAEIIGSAIATALSAGITDLQVSVGHVGFFQAICREWGLDEEVAALIESRQVVAIEDLCRARNLPDSVQQTLVLLASQEGAGEVLDALFPLTENPEAKAALENLRAVLNVLHEDGLEEYISVDMGMLQDPHYYTGMVFKGFTYGIGFPLFSGGRYDGVTQAYGRDLPATGFSLGVNLVMTALARQGKEVEEPTERWLAGYAAGARTAAVKAVAEMRAQGMQIGLDCRNLDEQALLEAARQSGASQVLYVRSDGTKETYRTSS